MSKNTLVTAISVSPQIDTQLNLLQKKLQKNRSQLIRDLLNYYLHPAANQVKSPESSTSTGDSSDPNTVLKHFYQLVSSQKPKPTIVIGIAILNKKSKVIIGLRKNKDKLVTNLTWTFPSGQFKSLNFEPEIIQTIRSETGLEAKVIHLVHARLIPDSYEKNVRIVALYYHCRILSGTQRPGGDFKELKWVPATEVTRHFTTSVSDEIINYLGSL